MYVIIDGMFVHILHCRYVVILNDYACMQEAFVKNSVAFAQRPTYYTTQVTNPRQKGNTNTVLQLFDSI